MKTALDISSLLRPDLRDFVPYSSARSLDTAPDAVLLDANENPSERRGASTWRYPDPQQRELRDRFAQLRGVSPDNVFVGNGSDEAIDLLVRAFCRPGVDEVVVQPPTYGMYTTVARLNGVSVVEVPLDARFDIDLPSMKAKLRPQARIAFVCSPNNPTGNCVDRNALRQLLEAAPGLVVVDEAYVDFCPESTWLPELQQYPNLVVLQTLSKAWSAAGIRVGLLLGHPEVVRILRAIKPPYNVSSVSQAIAVDVLENESIMRSVVESVVQRRQALEAALQKVPEVVTVFPSQANFLLVRFRDAGATLERLRSQAIVVRDRSMLPGCQNCLRITVGTASENQQLLEALTLGVEP